MSDSPADDASADDASADDASADDASADDASADDAARVVEDRVVEDRGPRLLHGARLVEAGSVTDDAWLLLRDGVVAARGSGSSWRARAGDAEVLDVSGLTAVPGFVDLHRHGGGGAAHEDGPDAVLAAHRAHLAHGTTRGTVSFVSAPVDVLVGRLAAAADVVEAEPGLLGSHLEGPFLAVERRGAHDPDALVDPAPAAVDALLRAARGTLRQVTLDPLRDGADEALRRFRAAGVVVAVGHTACDGPAAASTFAAGARLLTHAFNAMEGIGHRAPGPVVAAVDDPRVVLELILDGEHVHPSVAALLLRAAPGRVALVTDAMAAAAWHDGRYRLGRLEIEVSGRRATLAGTGTLAGSTLTQDAALRVGLAAGVDERLLVGALTAVPARVFGLRGVGGLAVGDAADVVLLDADHRVVRVLASRTPTARGGPSGARGTTPEATRGPSALYERAPAGVNGPMTDSKDAGSSWKSAGEKLSDLGATLKSHYDRQRAEDAPARSDVSDAMKKLAGVLQDAADAARDAAKDPAVKHDLKDVGRTLGTALGATAEQVAVEVKRAFDQRQAGKQADGTTPSAPVPAAGTATGDVWTETADTVGTSDTSAPTLSDPPQDPPRPNTPPPGPAPQVPPGSADPSI